MKKLQILLTDAQNPRNNYKNTGAACFYFACDSGLMHFYYDVSLFSYFMRTQPHASGALLLLFFHRYESAHLLRSVFSWPHLLLSIPVSGSSSSILQGPSFRLHFSVFLRSFAADSCRLARSSGSDGACLCFSFLPV